MAHRPDAEIIATTHNTARFFTENRQISWVALLIVIAWGIYGYDKMPKRKDPDIPVKEAQVICAWPGVSADRVEQLVTRKIEQKLAEVSEVRAPSAEEYSIKSLTLDGLSVVNVQVDYNVKDTKPVFNEMDLKLRSITDLPKGAGPIQFFSGFGDTAALMLTVASPKETEVAISLRAREIAAAIKTARGGGDASKRATIVVAFPLGLDSPNIGESLRETLGPCLAESGSLGDIRPIAGRGFVGLDGIANSDDQLQRAFMACVEKKYGSASFDPDIWQPFVVRNPDDAQARLDSVAGDKYSYRELDDFTDLIQRGLTGVPQVSKILISGDLPQWINLEYSQSKLAAYGITPSQYFTGAVGAKYCFARRLAGNQRPQPYRTAVRRVQKRKGYRRHDHRQVRHRHAVCTFAISSPSRAATRTPRAISTPIPCATPPAAGKRIARSRSPYKCVRANRSTYSAKMSITS